MIWLLAVILGISFGFISYCSRLLTAGGALAGGLFAASLVAFGGAAWAVPSLTFFVLSSLLSRIRSRRKAAAERKYAKGHVRDVGQVLANGGVGWALLLLYAAHLDAIFYWGFLGAFSAAAADTWATEIGGLAAGRPRLITSLQPVPPGTSGGITLLGLIGALAGAVVVWLSTLIVVHPVLRGVNTTAGMFAIVSAGLAGMLIDSLLGATLQAQYLDPATGEITERMPAAAPSAPLARGWQWVHNDAVNFVCTASGAVFAMSCYALQQG